MTEKFEDVDSFDRKKVISERDLQSLLHIPIFGGLSKENLQSLLRGATVRLLDEGEILFQEGDPADAFYVVTDGWIKLFRLTETGQEVVISVMSKGESFAEAAMFDSGDFPVSACSASLTRLVKIKAASVKETLRKDPDMAFNMLASMSKHMRKNIALVHQLATLTTTGRLAQFFLDLCDSHEGHEYINLPLEKSLIASRLGMQPESFSRALRKLRVFGVTCEGRNVHIEEISKLKAALNR